MLNFREVRDFSLGGKIEEKFRKLLFYPLNYGTDNFLEAQVYEKTGKRCFGT
mgnify:CR=1 FL=1